MSKSRVVHYVGAARDGTFFPCYRQELNKAMNERERYARPVAPWPKTTTSLIKVTCPECWIRIKALADSALGDEAVDLLEVANSVGVKR